MNNDGPSTAAIRSLLFVGKGDDEFTTSALNFCVQQVEQVEIHLGNFGDPMPSELDRWEGQCIVSYLAPWILSPSVLSRASGPAINFHPAPPEYPGIGCYNFALYDGVTDYGVTCHHMAARVDTGPIVQVARFPVLESDTVASLVERTQTQQLALFREVMGSLFEGRELPTSTETWARRPYTRRELDALARITPSMSEIEVTRRVRATTFGRWRPTVEIHGFVFKLAETNIEA